MSTKLTEENAPVVKLLIEKEMLPIDIEKITGVHPMTINRFKKAGLDFAAYTQEMLAQAKHAAAGSRAARLERNSPKVPSLDTEATSNETEVLLEIRTLLEKIEANTRILNPNHDRN